MGSEPVISAVADRSRWAGGEEVDPGDDAGVPARGSFRPEGLFFSFSMFSST
jgi:hypothetical protein